MIVNKMLIYELNKFKPNIDPKNMINHEKLQYSIINIL